MQKLTGAQRKYLRGLAHGLKPVSQIGRNGLTEPLLESLGEALGHHELIKVKFMDFKDEKKAFCAEISDRLECEHVGLIGHVAIFYRPAATPEARQIVLPMKKQDTSAAS